MKSLKKVVATVVASTIVLGMTACGGGSSTAASTSADKAAESTTVAESVAETPTEKVEIEFWGWWSSEARKPHILNMVEGFNNSQDRIHVTYVDIPWSDIFTKNIAQIVAGNPCDVMAGNFGDISYRAGLQQLTAMDEYMPDGFMDKFHDSFAEGCKGEDGQTYAIPLVCDTRFLYYNKALLAEAGVSEENGNLPKTWAELQELSYKLDKYNADGSIDVMGFHPLLGNAGYDAWVVNANKGKLWLDLDTNELLVNTDTNKEALNYINEYTDHYTQRVLQEYTDAFSSGMADPFCSGKLAMILHTNAYRSAIKQNAPDLDYGVLLMPEMTAGNGNYINGGGFTLEVPYGSKHPAEAMEFIEWMTSPEIQSYWALNMGEVPAVKSIDNPELGKDLVYNASIEALKQTYVGEYPNFFAGFKDILNPELDLIKAGSKSVDDALADADKQIRATYPDVK